MLVDLKLRDKYDGLLYFAETARHLHMLHSHRHDGLEANLIVSGTHSYVVDGERFTFLPGTLLWFFPEQEHLHMAQSPDAQVWVAHFKHSLIEKSFLTAFYDGLKRKSYEGGGILHTNLKPENADFLKKTMRTVMEGSLDPDLLNREAGYGQASDFIFEHNDPDALNAGLHFLLPLCWRFQAAGGGSPKPVPLSPVVIRALNFLNDGGR